MTHSINVNGWKDVLKHNSGKFKMLMSSPKARKNNLQRTNRGFDLATKEMNGRGDFSFLFLFPLLETKFHMLRACAYYQRGVFEKILRTSRSQLRFSNINSQRVIIYLESKSWALRGSCNPQVGSRLSF